MKESVIFDLDGTLALIDHRRHFVEGENKNWEDFYKACVDDKPNVPVIEMFKMLKNSGYYMFILSGRSDEVIGQTVDWLHSNHIYYDRLLMRSKGDYTTDEILKQEWLYEYVLGREILCVFDDRNKVVDMWRENGLTCFQVAKGDF